MCDVCGSREGTSGEVDCAGSAIGNGSALIHRGIRYNWTGSDSGLRHERAYEDPRAGASQRRRCGCTASAVIMRSLAPRPQASGMWDLGGSEYG